MDENSGGLSGLFLVILISHTIFKLLNSSILSEVASYIDYTDFYEIMYKRYSVGALYNVCPKSLDPFYKVN